MGRLSSSWKVCFHIPPGKEAPMWMECPCVKHLQTLQVPVGITHHNISVLRLYLAAPPLPLENCEYPNNHIMDASG